MNAVLIVAFALGMRHGTDPDHLAAIDGLTRIRPRSTNGVFFALGHGFVVLLLAVGVGHIIAERFSRVGPWTLIVLGAINLWRLLRGAPAVPQEKRPIVAQPFLLGVLLAAGFETSSQLAALILAGRSNTWLTGAAFAAGMILVDGVDGVLAASTQRLAVIGQESAQIASKLFGILVVVFSFGLGGAELMGIELNHLALPLGVALFVIVIGIRVWARSNLQWGASGAGAPNE